MNLLFLNMLSVQMNSDLSTSTGPTTNTQIEPLAHKEVRDRRFIDIGEEEKLKKQIESLQSKVNSYKKFADKLAEASHDSFVEEGDMILHKNPNWSQGVHNKPPNYDYNEYVSIIKRAGERMTKMQQVLDEGPCHVDCNNEIANLRKQLAEKDQTISKLTEGGAKLKAHIKKMKSQIGDVDNRLGAVERGRTSGNKLVMKFNGPVAFGSDAPMPIMPRSASRPRMLQGREEHEDL